jgi:hypothetical protein
MTARKHDVENKGAKQRNQVVTRPHFWHNARRDWHVWIAAVLMIAPMLVYVLTDNLSMRPGQVTSEPIPAANVR